MTTKSPLTNLLSGVLGGLVVLVIGAVLIATDVIDTGDTTTVVRESPTSQTTAASTGATGRTARDIYKQEGRGVVFIQSEGVTSDSESPFGAPQQGTATGSGFVVDNDGTIVTNAHVVEGADKVQVRFDENGEFVDAEVKGVDTSTDVAVLKIDPSDVDGLTPLPLGDSSKLQVGDPVIAIGNPFGYSRTVTTGIVSGLQREIQAPERLHDPRRDPDGRLDQPGQLRWAALRCERPRDRHQLADRDRRRPGLGGHRLRGAGQHSQEAAARPEGRRDHRARLPRVCRCRT